ncbi:hypothetical protein P3342_013078 [Pyrenophora teres f. teres]|nr:hypothetical protein P3342_013078 [Pyrenophora teres f. teres]
MVLKEEVLGGSLPPFPTPFYAPFVVIVGSILFIQPSLMALLTKQQYPVEQDASSQPFLRSSHCSIFSIIQSCNFPLNFKSIAQGPHGAAYASCTDFPTWESTSAFITNSNARNLSS